MALLGTVFMTLSISIERYLCICHPMHTPRKAWFYIVPVTLLAFAFNIPKFFDYQLEHDYNENDEVVLIM